MNGQVKIKVKAKVTSHFNKDNSWVRTGAQTPGLLEHEQYHLDISEYWARQLEEALNGIEVTGATAAEATAKANAEVSRIADRMEKKCDELQEQYDDETDHGRKPDKQAEWCKKIGDLLNPPKAENPKTGGEKQNMEYNPENGGLSLPGGLLESFTINGEQLFDPVLSGASVSMSTMFYEGNRMENPWFFASPYEDSFEVITADGDLVIQGTIRMMMGDETGSSFTGWISSAEIATSLEGSPFLDALEGTYGHGLGVLTISLSMDIPLVEATNGWTSPANTDGFFSLGVSNATNPCDVNCDGKVDDQDMVALQSILDGTGVACSNRGGDLDGDGQITGWDAVLLEDCLVRPVPLDQRDVQMKNR